MKRRQFISDVFKISIVGAGITIIPIQSVANYLETFSAKLDFEPYMIDVNEKFVKEELKKSSMPTAVKRKAIQITPERRIWLIGEGRDNLINFSIESKLNETTQYGYTPVAQLHGVKGGHVVYGQWYEIRPKDLRGVIKGFDSNYYSVHHNFKDIFTHKYYCYGLPASNYTVKKCSYCGQQYIYQDFKTSCDSKEIRLYTYHRGCQKSSTGYHNNLNLKDVEPCGTIDKFDIGQSF